MKILKETKSISPLTKKVIPARIVEDNGQVYMVKEDENGNTHKNILEKDTDLYKSMASEKAGKAMPYHNIKLSVSGECNLDCQICCAAYSVYSEPSLAEIESFLSKYKNRYILLCGREPTMRSDLPQIIEVVNKRNYSVILTNGLKLADYEYVLSLKRAGLNLITFSFNSFDDKVYKAMNGQALLDIKLKALRNIKRAGLPVCISVTLAKGVNEDQLKSIYNYCIENSSFVHELRIRTLSNLGRNRGTEQYYLSELLDCICNAADISRDAVLKEVRFLREVALAFRQYHFLPKLCTGNFHILVNGNNAQPVGDKINYIPSGTSMFRFISLPYYILKYYGFLLIKKILYDMRLTESEGYPRLLRIRLKCWPNIYNVDLEEIEKCSGGYYKVHEMDKCSSFCLYKITNNNSC